MQLIEEEFNISTKFIKSEFKTKVILKNRSLKNIYLYRLRKIKKN
jgi:hypothetical protein